MYSKVSIAFISALATIGQAIEHHGHDHLHRRQYGSFPSASGSGFSLPPGLVPFSSGVSGAPSSAPYPIKTGTAPSGAPLSTGGVPLSTGTAPLSTGIPLSTGSGSSPSSAGGSGDITLTYTTTLTYTIGSGSSTTVITTTIHRTVYHTDTAVSFCQSTKKVLSILTSSQSAQSAAASASSEGAEGATTAHQTLYKTIQSTIYVPSASATGSVTAANLLGHPAESGSGGAGGAGGNCAAPATVTVTGAAVTVTVVSFNMNTLVYTMANVVHRLLAPAPALAPQLVKLHLLPHQPSAADRSITALNRSPRLRRGPSASPLGSSPNLLLASLFTQRVLALSQARSR